MIVDKDLYFRKSHKYLEDGKDIKHLLDFMLKTLIENRDIPMVKRVLIDIRDIIFGDSKFFISTDYPNVFKLRKKREEIRKTFINFFLEKHIEETISLYKFYKNQPVFLVDYLPILIRFLPEAKPDEKYFVDLFLILGDVLSDMKKEKSFDESFDEIVENIAIKGLLRYSVNKEIFRNILNDRQEKKFEDMHKDVLPYENFVDYFKESLDQQIKLIKMGKFNVEIASLCIFNSSFLNLSIWKELYRGESVVKLHGKMIEKREEIKNFIEKELHRLELSIGDKKLIHNLEEIIKKLAKTREITTDIGIPEDNKTTLKLDIHNFSIANKDF